MVIPSILQDKRQIKGLEVIPGTVGKCSTHMKSKDLRAMVITGLKMQYKSQRQQKPEVQLSKSVIGCSLKKEALETKPKENDWRVLSLEKKNPLTTSSEVIKTLEEVNMSLQSL